MGFPTFTFETDDEQFLLGTVEALSDRLSEELDVMRYLIQNVWYWRARLVVNSLVVDDGKVHLSVSNLGHASTSNATLAYLDEDGEWWIPGGIEEVFLDHAGIYSEVHTCDDEWGLNLSIPGCGFGVNATNSTVTTLEFSDAPISSKGQFYLVYQKRVIDSSIWVNESVNQSVVEMKVGGSGLLPAPSMLLVFVAFALAAINSRNRKFE